MQLLRRKPNQFCNLNHSQWIVILAGLKVFWYTFSLGYNDAIDKDKFANTTNKELNKNLIERFRARSLVVGGLASKTKGSRYESGC